MVVDWVEEGGPMDELGRRSKDASCVKTPTFSLIELRCPLLCVFEFFAVPEPFQET